MIIEKIKTYIITLGAIIAAIFFALLTGEYRGKKAQQKTEETDNAQAEIKQMQEAQQTFQDAKHSEQSVPSIPTPDVEKRDDLNTDH